GVDIAIRVVTLDRIDSDVGRDDKADIDTVEIDRLNRVQAGIFDSRGSYAAHRPKGGAAKAADHRANRSADNETTRRAARPTRYAADGGVGIGLLTILGKRGDSCPKH